MNRSYLIIGCGHFGSLAVEKLLRKDPHSKITIVDENERAFKKVSHLPIETIVSDGRYKKTEGHRLPYPHQHRLPLPRRHLYFFIVEQEVRGLALKLTTCFRWRNQQAIGIKNTD